MALPCSARLVAAGIALLTSASTSALALEVTSSVADRLARPLGIALLIADVKQVTDLLGPSAAAPGDSFVCYVAPNHQVFIRFLIDPLQTSANRRRNTMAFNMRELAGMAAAECGGLDPSVESHLDLTVAGVRLGMTRDEVTAVLGPAHGESGEREFYQFVASERPLPDGSQRDLVVSARFRGDMLTELDISAARRRAHGSAATRGRDLPSMRGLEFAASIMSGHAVLQSGLRPDGSVYRHILSKECPLELYPGLREVAERDGMTGLPQLPDQFRRPNPAP